MTLEQRKKAYLEYLKLKLYEQDWHAVSDAANDLRELEIELQLSPTVVGPALPPMGEFNVGNIIKNTGGTK